VRAFRLQHQTAQQTNKTATAWQASLLQGNTSPGKKTISIRNHKIPQRERCSGQPTEQHCTKLQNVFQHEAVELVQDAGKGTKMDEQTGTLKEEKEKGKQKLYGAQNMRQGQRNI
jgi:hypothetical protein